MKIILICHYSDSGRVYECKQELLKEFENVDIEYLHVYEENDHNYLYLDKYDSILICLSNQFEVSSLEKMCSQLKTFGLFDKTLFNILVKDPESTLLYFLDQYKDRLIK